MRVPFRIAPVIQKISSGLIPSELRQNPDVLRHATRVAAFDLAMLIWVVVFAAIYPVLGSLICANVVMWGGLMLFGSLWALQRGKPPEF